MIVTVRLKDEVYEKYVAMDRQQPARAVEKQLERFQDVNLASRTLVLSVAERQELEKLLDTTLENGKELITRVRRMVSMDVGGEPVRLTEGQRKRLSDEARHLTKNPSAHATERVTRLLFDGLGA
jgi:hypothetical protein